MWNIAECSRARLLSPPSRSAKDQFVDTRQLHSINDSMRSAFEGLNAILLFTCHQWLGMSALCNKKRSPAFSLLVVFFSAFFFFFPPLSH